MNWFERYGIVGTYFLGILSLALLGLDYFNLFDAKSNAHAIVALFAFLILPVGYIICLVSQVFYYFGVNGEQIHKSVIDELGDNDRKDLAIPNNAKELEMEIILTIKHRLSKNCSQIQFLSSFATKRWDFLALNSALRLSTVFFYLVLIVLILSKKCYSISPSVIFVVSLSVIWGLILFVILHISDKISCFQIKQINKAITKEVLEQKNQQGPKPRKQFRERLP